MSEPIKHSPTPWNCNQSDLISIIYNKDGNAIGHIQLSGHVVNAANAAHIVRCVNLHEELVAVLERLICLSHVPERLQDDEWEKSLALCLETLNKAQ